MSNKIEMTFGEEFAPITPANFFQVGCDCRRLPDQKGKVFPLINDLNYRSYLLPDTSALCSERSFAQIALGWSEDGLEFYVEVAAPFRRAFYPDVQRGDSVELFIDTRDVKTSGFNTRFCHHFFFLAEAIDGLQAGEITRFRTEDSHPHCDAKELKVNSLCEPSRYLLNIFIPNHCLYGYDPGQFRRLGIAYRVNQAGGFAQHFTVTSDDYQIDQHPSQWASVMLV